MKPFNLEEAKAGKPVCTRDGRPVRILCFDINSDNDYVILALITTKDNSEISYSYTKDGKFLKTEDNHPNDLMMVDDEFKSTKTSKEFIKYIPIYKNSTTGDLAYAGVYSSFKKAANFGKKVPDDGLTKYIGVGEARIKLIEEKQHFVGYIGLLPNRNYNSNYNINPNILKLCTNIYKSKETIPVATNIVKIEWEE